MAAAVADTEIIVHTEQLLAKLREIPGIADKEFKAMAGAISKQYAKAAAEAEKSAKKIAADSAKAAEKSAQEWSRGTEWIAKKIASMTGGVGADLLDLGTDGAGAIGAIGVGAAAAAGGVAILSATVVGGATAVVSLVTAAEEARDRLHEMGVEVPMSSASIAALDDWKTMADGASVQTEILTVQVGALVASAFLPAAEAALGLASELGDLLPTVNQLSSGIDTLQSGTRVFGAIVSLGITEVVRYAVGLEDLSEAGREAAEALGMQVEQNKALAAHKPVAEAMLKLTEETAFAETGASKARSALFKQTQEIDATTEKYIESLRTLNVTEDERLAMEEAASSMAEARKEQLTEEVELAEDAAQATKDSAAASKAKAAADKEASEAAREATRAEQERVKALQATDQLHSLINATTADTLGAEEEIERAYQARIDAVEKLAAAGASAADVEEATTQAELRRQRELFELSESRADAAAEEAEAYRAMQRDLDDLQSSVDDLTESWDIAGLTVQAYAEATNEALNSDALRAFGDVWNDVVGAMEDQYQDLMDAAEARYDHEHDLFEKARDDRNEEIESWLEGEQDKIDHLLETGQISEEEAREAKRRADAEANRKQKLAILETQRQKKELEQRHQDEMAAAMKAFKANQRLQKTQAVIEGFRAGIALIPAFAWMGPGAPVAAATLAAASTGIAVAAIAAQDAPEFPTGRAPLSRSPDHRMVGVRDDEPIMPGRWVSAMGGPGAVKDMIDHNTGPAAVTNIYVDGALIASKRGGGDQRFSAPSWATGKRPLF